MSGYRVREQCPQCLTWADHRPGPECADAVERRAGYLQSTVLVGGRRRETLLCECGALMVAGIDHTCDPEERAARGLAMT